MEPRRKPTRTAGRALQIALLSGLALAFLLPFYWLAISAFKSQGEIFATPPTWFPHPVRWQNFAEIVRETHIVRAFFNSCLISAGHVTLALFLCSLAGYAFAKFPTAPGHKRLFAFVLGTMMIPGAVTLIPTFVVFMKLDLINTFWAVILPGSASAFGIFWMRQYIAAHVPDDFLHAGRIDGCSEFGIYWRIVLPIAQPALAALGTILLIGSWNGLLWPFLVLRTQEMETLPVLIYLLQGETRTPFGMLMAGGFLTTAPLVLAFIAFQRHFIAGIATGAVKG